MVRRHVNWLLELLLYQWCEQLHFSSVSMDKHDAFRVYVSQQVYNAFGVSMSRKGNIYNPHFYLILFFIDSNLFDSLQQLVP